MPILQGALLCDAAADYGGKVSILGGFVSIVAAPMLPMPAPIAFAGRIAFTDEEARHTHSIYVRAVTPNGDQAAEVRGEFRPQPPVALVPGLMGGANLVFPFPFPIMTLGTYRVELSVDEDPAMVSLPLVVVDQLPGQ